MEPHYELLNVSFSTADAEFPRIVSERGRLSVTFLDWRSQVIVLVFHDVAAFSWDDGDAAIDLSHRDDCCYVVHESAWLARHREVGTLSLNDGQRHFKLCFNAAGVLQILASRLEVTAQSDCT